MNTEHRTSEESYASACSSSNLTVDDASRGDSDYIIAAGMSKHATGNALMRLQSEYDKAEHPRMALGAQFYRQAEREKKGQPASVIAARAHELAHAHNLHETGLLLQQLKTWPAVRQIMIGKALSLGMTAAEDKAVKVLRWFLSKTCTACGGTKWEVVPGTNRHGAKQCKACQGTGVAKIPCGEDGRKLAGYIDECMYSAKGSISRLTRGHKNTRLV